MLANQFTDKMDKLGKTSPDSAAFSKYKASRIEQGFTVSHYAGKVEYRTQGWLTKNRDPLNENLTSVLSKSTDSYVSTMFAEYADVEVVSEGPRTRIRRGAFRTVGQRHKEDLAALMSQLNATQPHFIRCIVPNVHKQPGLVEVRLVLTQLRCNGVLEGIRIARIGFPNRLPFAEFRRRFAILGPPTPRHRTAFVEGKEACSAILRSLDLDAQSYRLGLTKVFFKAGILAELESRRDDCLADIITRLQATCRRHIERRRANRVLHRSAAVETIQRNARIYIALRQWPWWKLYQQVRPLLAAARSDDEMKRREQELASAKEQAAAQALVRQRLEAERVELEDQRATMEKALASERALAADKDAALERGLQRETALREQLQAVETDLQAVEERLSAAIKAKEDSDQRIARLDTAYANQTKLLETLQAEQAAWKVKEAELASQTSVKTAEWERIVSERDTSVAAVSELKRQLSEAGQDRRREESRLTLAVTSLETRLAASSKDASDIRRQLLASEGDRQAAVEARAVLQKESESLRSALASKEADLKRSTSGEKLRGRMCTCMR